MVGAIYVVHPRLHFVVKERKKPSQLEV